MLMVCLKSRQRPSVSPDTWIGFFDPQAPAFRLIILLYQAAEASAKIREFVTLTTIHQNESIAVIGGILTSTTRLDDDFEDWSENVPIEWMFLSNDFHQWTTCSGMESKLHGLSR